MDDTHHRARIEAIHAKHSLALLRYLIRFAGERHAAEDMVQETMLRAWRHRDSLPGDENGVRAWLFTVARNVAIDADRMRRVRPAEVALTDLNDTVAAADTPDSALAAQEMARAFAKLSEMQRDVIRHLYFRGDTIEEVATRLGIPAGTVKSRAHYGVQALRAAVTAGAEMGTRSGAGGRSGSRFTPGSPGHMTVVEQLEWLAVVRHGQSTGNVAAAHAEATGAEIIDIPERDADVPLSETGREQAAALRHVLAQRRLGVAVISPYLRARQTAEAALAGLSVPARVDERLRDRELGVLDLLTTSGVSARLPDEARRRERLGKFYYRPPGGESWTDVLLRLRSLLGELRAGHPGGRVVLFAHEATVLLVRYLVEGLDEEQLMSVARSATIANCSISSWRRGDGALRPEMFNDVAHLPRKGAPVTRQEDVHA